MQTNRIAAVPRRLAAAVALIALAAAATGAEAAAPKGAASTKPAQPALFYTGSPDAAAFKAACDDGMKNAKAALDRMLAVTGKRTVANTLEAYNEVIVHAYNVAYPAGLMESVHPDSAYRATAEGVTQEIDKFLTDLSLNRAVYDAIVAVDAKGLDPETRYFRERTLREFRRSGVDRDEATRKRVSELNERLTLLSQQFSRNIRNDRRFVTVNSAEDLKGLPEDYVKAHPPGEDGKIKITIETPDYIPVMKYAENADLRRKLRLERQNRAYPVNMGVLDSLILVRHELATLLGYPHWAAYVTEDKMIGTAENAAAFLDRVSKLVVEPARDEYQVYLKAKREYDPGATAVDLSEASYIENIIRKRDYDFDSQAARPYFAFQKVKKGVMDLSAQIFNVRFQKIEGAEVWHPSVEAYEVYDGKKLLGRFFLDLHPRDGKYQHAAQFGIHKGVRGVQIPEAALVCNFPGDREGDPGLMEHSDVQTFFHEFGHLLHSIFGGDVKWIALSGTGVERDFVEAPSQMLEEWIWDPAVLATFAKHHETGEPIPAAMVEKMRRAETFGRGIDVAFQLFLANLSLNIYNKDPKDVNTSAVVAKYERELVPFPPMEGTHMQTSFGHLDGYSAVYYTYQWSLVIAKDLFSKFDKTKLLDPAMPTKYRKTVLAPGGSKPAADVVRAFLGRDFNYDAYEAWIREGMPSKAN
ncbi:MAG TPA: M3 family metallopeptidase [Candidatus Eisenbacteria bacterium]|nr:M3 family metallopeptidase [Candidatus Eisenbacteria bacterium]